MNYIRINYGKLFTMKRRDKILLAIICVIILLFTFFIVYSTIEKPNYIDLVIPSSSQLPLGDWDSIYYSIFEAKDSYRHVFILRKENLAFQAPENLAIYTPEQVLSYYTRWLEGNGWIQANIKPFYKCNLGLPEKNWIDIQKGIYDEFIINGDDPYSPSKSVCIAVWGTSPDHPSTFTVVFITTNLSPITNYLISN